MPSSVEHTLLFLEKTLISDVSRQEESPVAHNGIRKREDKNLFCTSL